MCKCVGPNPSRSDKTKTEKICNFGAAGLVSSEQQKVTMKRLSGIRNAKYSDLPTETGVFLLRIFAGKTLRQR